MDGLKFIITSVLDTWHELHPISVTRFIIIIIIVDWPLVVVNVLEDFADA